MADDTVCCEPFSAGKFPAQQGKNREFPRFWPEPEPPGREKPMIRRRFLNEFPTPANREFSKPHRELNGRIREFLGVV